MHIYLHENLDCLVDGPLLKGSFEGRQHIFHNSLSTLYKILVIDVAFRAEWIIMEGIRCREDIVDEPDIQAPVLHEIKGPLHEGRVRVTHGTDILNDYETY